MLLNSNRQPGTLHFMLSLKRTLCISYLQHIFNIIKTSNYDVSVSALSISYISKSFFISSSVLFDSKKGSSQNLLPTPKLDKIPYISVDRLIFDKNLQYYSTDLFEKVSNVPNFRVTIIRGNNNIWQFKDNVAIINICRKSDITLLFIIKYYTNYNRTPRSWN